MTSDVKFSHYFLLVKLNIGVFLTLKSFRKQFQSTTQSVNAGKRLRLSTDDCKLFLFNLIVLKFELQYEWNHQKYFFCGFWVLQLLCHNIEGTHDIKCGRK